jgi:translation initiation factor IF-3
VPQVRVIGEDGEQFGVLDTRDAIRRAREQGMDLVEVAPNAEPPVCKIIDFGKFQYEAKKKANEAKKKQVVITVKEIKFRPGTDVHDYSYRMKRAREWLQEGNKIKATIWFRGREMTHRELGSRILEQLEKDLIEVGDVEMRPRMEGNQMFTIFAPKKHGGGKGGGGSHQSPARPEPARAESPQSEPARAESPRSEPAAPESPRPEPAPPESEPKTEPKTS